MVTNQYSFCVDEEVKGIEIIPMSGGKLRWFTDAALTDEITSQIDNTRLNRPIGIDIFDPLEKIVNIDNKVLPLGGSIRRTTRFYVTQSIYTKF